MSTAASSERPINPTLVLAIVCMGQFMVVLDVAIVNVALPTIQVDLMVSQSDLQWAVIAYGIFLGGFLLLGGRAADLLGRRKVFIAGLAIFAGSSLVAGFAGDLNVLVAARAVQGFGAALTAASGLSLLTATFEEGQARTQALGIWGAVSATGATFGVILSGLLTDGPGWEWIFFINVPVGIVLITAALLFLVESRGARPSTLDIPGAFTVTAALVLLVFGVNRGEQWGWGDTRTLGVLALSAILFVAFVIIEKRSREPLVPLDRLTERTVGTANVAAFLLLASFFSLIFIGTLYMQQVLGYTALEAGLAWLATSLTAFVAAAMVGTFLVERLGVRIILIPGFSMLIVALFGLASLDENSSFVSGLLPFLVLAGLGIGACFPSLQVAAFHGFTEKDSGLASGLINTSQEVGGAVGVAVLATVAVEVTNGVLEDDPGTDPAAALSEGFSWAFLIGAFIAVVGLAVSSTLRAGGSAQVASHEADGGADDLAK